MRTVVRAAMLVGVIGTLLSGSGSCGEGGVQPVEHRLVGPPEATRVGVLPGPLVFGKRDQGGGGAGEGPLDQLRLAVEVLVVLGVHDQSGGRDLVGDAVYG